MTDFSPNRRQALLQEFAQLQEKTFGKKLAPTAYAEAIQRMDALLAEYVSGLPRLPLSCCPFCSAPLLRSFDPYGLDGPWWWEARIFKIQEPTCCSHFKVLLGAVDLHGRAPKEVKEQVYPGPGAPFVVPDLFQLPSMKAVVGNITLTTGDTAYPIAYFSPESIHPSQLHPPWGRLENWFDNGGGQSGWNRSESTWDFELAPHVAAGRVSWVDLSAPTLTFLTTPEAPWGPPAGVRAQQQIIQGEVGELPLPSGESGCPFE